MIEDSMQFQTALLPPGGWAVGVSGGADSVALLSLLRHRPASDTGATLHAVHLNHQARGGDSDDDERFVRDLCGQWNIPCTIARRDQIEPALRELPANTSARYRAIRLALFQQVVLQRQLCGVAMAHHADDQAETVFHRLARGAGYLPLAGMSCDTTIGLLRVIRPLLHVRRQALREYLRSIHQPWREDASNLSDQYARNRIRKFLARNESLTAALLELGNACGLLKDWATRHAMPLDDAFVVATLCAQPKILADQSARAWLEKMGCPVGELSQRVIDRLLDMARDAATSPRRQFPGGLSISRRRGVVQAESTSVSHGAR